MFKKFISFIFIFIVWLSFDTPNGGIVFIDPTSVYAVRSRVVERTDSSKSFLQKGSEIILYNNEKIEVIDDPKAVVDRFKRALKKKQ